MTLQELLIAAMFVLVVALLVVVVSRLVGRRGRR
jgi:hypothetical protein